MAQKVVLHQWEISPFCQKAARTLRFKGIDFETVNYNGVLGAKVPLLSKVGKVPVLDIHGQRIQDSTRIARYLDENYPDAPRLYPKDPTQRALAELWEDWADESLYFYEVYLRVNDPEALKECIRISNMGRPAYEKMMVKAFILAELKTQLFFQGLGRMKAEDIHTEFRSHLDRIEQVLLQTGWLVGNTQTIADIAVVAQLGEVIRTSNKFGAEILARPAIASWYKKQCELSHAIISKE
ncbi:glutathione S-transferase family protein [Acinetobacter sp. AYS6]|uniref:glutathione S-transferase family protein n=1 Tax=Acinetobacter sp. AYS6 TaxID=2983297 RepID=UPI0021D68DCE|nr:glutathione S-transferase family protein [Acinetobacter sp. AYS6]MCU7696966.1 glutathione S-transferase family protein [Acinetobacter sp. AYS6]